MIKIDSWFQNLEDAVRNEMQDATQTIYNITIDVDVALPFSLPLV